MTKATQECSAWTEYQVLSNKLSVLPFLNNQFFSYPTFSNQLEFLISIINNQLRLSSILSNQLNFSAILSNQLNPFRKTLMHKTDIFGRARWSILLNAFEGPREFWIIPKAFAQNLQLLKQTSIILGKLLATFNQDILYLNQF